MYFIKKCNKKMNEVAIEKYDGFKKITNYTNLIFLLVIRILLSYYNNK